MRAFAEVANYDFEDAVNRTIVREIQSKGKDYILRIDAEEFKTYLHEKFESTKSIYQKTRHQNYS